MTTATLPSTTIEQARSLGRGRLAMYLFLASEVMFFLGLFAAYVVLRAANPGLFAAHADNLPVGLAAGNTIILLASSFALSRALRAAREGDQRKVIRALCLTLAAAVVFLSLKSVDYAHKFTHHTVLARDAAGATAVYDGRLVSRADEVTVIGHRMSLAAGAPFDPHAIAPADVARAQEAQSGNADAQRHRIPRSAIVFDLPYGPGKNLFYASYFTLTAVHAAHLLGGLIPVAWLLLQALRGRILPAHTEYTTIYWHFVDAVWILLFVTLYLT